MSRRTVAVSFAVALAAAASFAAASYWMLHATAIGVRTTQAISAGAAEAAPMQDAGLSGVLESVVAIAPWLLVAFAILWMASVFRWPVRGRA